MKRVRRWRRGLVAVGVAGAVVTLPAAQAGAVVSGPCRGAIKGVDVAPLSASDPKDAIEVAEDEKIEVSAEAAQPIDRYEVQLEFAGIKWTVGKGTTDGTSWSKVVDVADYSRYGAGLYRVHGVSIGPASCDGAALVKVGGNPLGKIAGLAGLGLAGLGAAGAAASTAKAAVEGDALASKRGFDPSQWDQSSFGEVARPSDYVRWVEGCVEQGYPPPSQVVDFIGTRGADVINRVCTRGFEMFSR